MEKCSNRMTTSLVLRAAMASDADDCTTQTTLLVADGSCPKIRELLAEALVPVLWLEAGQPPLETVTTALAERRHKGQPVESLHWVSHGRPGQLLIAGTSLDQKGLIHHQPLLSSWAVGTIALWSCDIGTEEGYISLWEELTGATVWFSRQPVGRLSTGEMNWSLSSRSHATPPEIPISIHTHRDFEHQLSAGSSAKILTFGALNQTTPIPITEDTNIQTSDFTNASWNPSKGIEIQASQPGTVTIGFASYVPENYTGPGAAYLYAVEVRDQNNNLIAIETFDDWTESESSPFSFDSASDEGIGEYNADLTWEAWSNNDPAADFFAENSIYTGLGDPFAPKIEGGDEGVVYPMDGAGPFSTLIGTQLSLPNGTTTIYINPTIGYNVSNGGDEERSWWVGFKYGDVPAKTLFSFTSSAEPAEPEPLPSPIQDAPAAAIEDTTPTDNTPTDPAPAGTNIQPTDDDGDGLREVVTASDGTTVDGNRDGTADAEQTEVAGLRLINDGAVGSDYGAVQVSAGTQLSAVTLISPNPETGVLAVTGRNGTTTLVALPSGISNNFAGAVAFDVSGLEIGGSTSTTISLPTGLSVDPSNSAYMRFNYLTNQFEEYVDAQGSPLYSFQDSNGDGTPDAVVLQLVDGDPQWDGDGVANGSVVDPGFLGNGQRNFTGTKRSDTLTGNVLANTMNGKAGRDWLQGDVGRDALFGGRDKDRLWGGLDADVINGGKDSDRILYFSVDESTADQADTATFGKNDRFKFLGFDGDSVTDGQQSLRYIGKKAFSGSAGELRFTSSGLQADTTGDGQADFVVNFAKATP
jgi:hypothetical protein